MKKAVDADENGKVTILDATVIRRHLAQLPSNKNIGKSMGCINSPTAYPDRPTAIVETPTAYWTQRPLIIYNSKLAIKSELLYLFIFY